MRDRYITLQSNSNAKKISRAAPIQGLRSVSEQVGFKNGR